MSHLAFERLPLFRCLKKKTIFVLMQTKRAMKKQHANNVLAVLAVHLLLLGCNSSIKNGLDKAECLMNNAPDSALHILSAMDTNSIHCKADRARFALLYSMALDKNWIDTTSTHLIMPAVTYYEKRGAMDEKMKSLYYLGRIYYNQKEYSKAIRTFTQAEELGQLSTDYNIRGLLAAQMALLFSKFHQNESQLAKSEEAMELFNKAGNTHYYNLSKGSLGVVNYSLKHWDVADSLFREGILAAQNDTVAMRQFLNSYALMKVSSPEPDPELTLQLFGRLISDYHGTISAYSYGAYAYALELTGQSAVCDSIIEQVSRRGSGAEKDLKRWLCLISYHRKDYKAAFSFFRDYYQGETAEVRELQSQSLAIAQREYYRAERDKAHSEAKNQRLVSIIVVLVLTLVSFIIITLLRVRIRKTEEKNKRLLEISEIAKRQLTEEQSVSQTQLARRDKTIEDLRKKYLASFQKEFEIIGQLCDSYLGPVGMRERKDVIFEKVHSIVQTISKDETQNRDFQHLIDEKLDNVLSDLRKDFPKQKESDFQYASYFIAGFDATTISIIMDTTANSVYIRKSRWKDLITKSSAIRKEEYLTLFN